MDKIEIGLRSVLAVVGGAGLGFGAGEVLNWSSLGMGLAGALLTMAGILFLGSWDDKEISNL